MVCPPGLTLTRPRSVLACHLALPHLQIEGENRSRPCAVKQACEKWTLTILQANFCGFPTKPAMHSNLKPATCSDRKPAGVAI
jgi:hypothetical protein